MEEAQELSDRVGIIDHGEIIAMGEQGDLIQQVGEEDRLYFKVGEQQVPEALLRRMEAEVEGVTRADYDPPGEGGEDPGNVSGKILVEARRGRRALAELIQLTVEAGIEIQSVEVREPDLEAVFLKLTGRELRD
jgi:ABC-2 type transport system ATP-binding protein